MRFPWPNRNAMLTDDITPIELEALVFIYSPTPVNEDTDEISSHQNRSSRPKRQPTH